MFDHIAATHPTFRSIGFVDGSARPEAPVVAPRDSARLTARVRASFASRLHRLASAVEPRQRRTRPATSPACR